MTQAYTDSSKIVGKNKYIRALRRIKVDQQVVQAIQNKYNLSDTEAQKVVQTLVQV